MKMIGFLSIFFGVTLIIIAAAMGEEDSPKWDQDADDAVEWTKNYLNELQRQG